MTIHLSVSGIFKRIWMSAPQCPAPSSRLSVSNTSKASQLEFAHTHSMRTNTCTHTCARTRKVGSMPQLEVSGKTKSADLGDRRS